MEVISLKLNPKSSSFTKDLVGINSSMEKLFTSYFGLVNKVCMIGICSMGGWERQLLLELFMIGSLTILKVLALLLMLGKF